MAELDDDYINHGMVQLAATTAALIAPDNDGDDSTQRMRRSGEVVAYG